MTSYRQGTGATKTITALGPVARTDGTPLAPSEISHYLQFISFNGTPGVPHAVNLVEDAATPEYDGAFDEVIDIDSQSAGVYTYWYRTVDVNGLESPDSPTLVLEILPPLAKPLPPTGLSVS